MIGKPSAKYKYVGGEPTYVKMMYQELTTPLQGVEGNQVCANDKYVAVSNSYLEIILLLIFAFNLDPMERRRWSIHGQIA